MNLSAAHTQFNLTSSCADCRNEAHTSFIHPADCGGRVTSSINLINPPNSVLTLKNRFISYQLGLLLRRVQTKMLSLWCSRGRARSPALISVSTYQDVCIQAGIIRLVYGRSPRAERARHNGCFLLLLLLFLSRRGRRRFVCGLTLKRPSRREMSASHAASGEASLHPRAAAWRSWVRGRRSEAAVIKPSYPQCEELLLVDQMQL